MKRPLSPVVGLALLSFASGALAETKPSAPTGSASSNAKLKWDPATAATLVKKAQVTLQQNAVPVKASLEPKKYNQYLDAVDSFENAAALDPKIPKECMEAAEDAQNALTLQNRYSDEMANYSYYASELSRDEHFINNTPFASYLQPPLYWCTLVKDADPVTESDQDQLSREQTKCDQVKRNIERAKKRVKDDREQTDMWHTTAKKTWADAIKLWKDAVKLCPAHYQGSAPPEPPPDNGWVL
jgi:hypothetical protein